MPHNPFYLSFQLGCAPRFSSQGPQLAKVFEPTVALQPGIGAVHLHLYAHFLSLEPQARNELLPGIVTVGEHMQAGHHLAASSLA